MRVPPDFLTQTQADQLPDAHEQPAVLPGSLCEQCLDAPAVAIVAAPWGGDMGICAACQAACPPVPPTCPFT